jgi:hypothetical protein
MVKSQMRRRTQSSPSSVGSRANIVWAAITSGIAGDASKALLATAILRRQGVRLNPKKPHRLYRVRRLKAEAGNARSTFVSDALAPRREFLILTWVDEFNQECHSSLITFIRRACRSRTRPHMEIRGGPCTIISDNDTACSRGRSDRTPASLDHLVGGDLVSSPAQLDVECLLGYLCSWEVLLLCIGVFNSRVVYCSPSRIHDRHRGEFACLTGKL